MSISACVVCTCVYICVCACVYACVHAGVHAGVCTAYLCVFDMTCSIITILAMPQQYCLCIIRTVLLQQDAAFLTWNAQ